jgi:hypothetical protein
MARYALPPNWEGFKDRDLASGDTLLEALVNGRIFNVAKTGDNYCIQERCDEYFSVILTPKQLFDLGTELQALATPYLDDSQNEAAELINPPSRLRIGDIWEFETEVKERGKIKPRIMQWRVVQWHAGELAWQLQSLDEKHFTYLMDFAPQYEDMKFIGTKKTP